MELVYLWVEDYKNIKKQGFNFSPKFECSYNEDTKELSIDEKEHIKDFFGENINVTAIVGENGSGKSSIKKYNLQNDPIFDDYIIETISPFTNKELFLIIYIEDKLKKISMYEFINKLVTKFPDSNDIIIGTKGTLPKCQIINYPELPKDELKFFNIHFNYMLDTMYDGVQDKWIKSIYHKADSYETPLLLEPYKNRNGAQQIDLDTIEYLNNQNMLRFYSEFDTKKELIDFFEPNRISLNFSVRNFDWSNLNSEDFECLKDCKYFIAYKFFELYNDNNVFLELREESKNIICEICSKIDNYYLEKKYKELNYLYIVLKVLSSKKELFNKVEYKKIGKWASDLSSVDNLFDFIDTVNLSALISVDAPKYEVMKINTCIDFHNNAIYEDTIFTKNLEKTIHANIDELQSIFPYILSWIDVEWFENSKSLKSLSSGEKILFTFLINLMYQVQNINNRIEYNTINLFLDETELGFHPQWQKKYLTKILNAIKTINTKKINLIFATHSPFILSDLPKENVIFLEKGKQVNVNINPFGANIHTLLSHGFFMKDGLMGEFAKGKIEDLINYLNNKKSDIKDNDEAQKLLNIIGEPVIKNQLQKMLDSKRLSKVDEVNQKIKDMEYDLRILKQNQNKYIQDELNDKAKKRYRQGKDDDK